MLTYVIYNIVRHMERTVKSILLMYTSVQPYVYETSIRLAVMASSPMAESTDQWATQGKKNIFGHPVKLVEMQSEG